VAHSSLRCREAAKLGFGRALAPAAQSPEGGLALSGFRTLGAFVDHLLGR
jgi:DNA repair protein RadA/Sms